jgi:hypothetical protein
LKYFDSDDKAQIIMDIEATADGFYRRLEEKEEDA